MKKRIINKKFIIIVLILFISIGFAYLTSNLNITGLATLKRSVWDVHFENIVNENEDVLTINSPAQITNNNFTLTVQLKYNQADLNSKERVHLQYVNRQTPGVISVGDEIAVDTEHFYVVSSDKDKTVLLAKYNLLVGANYSADATTVTKSFTQSDEGYGMQNENAKGYTSENQPRTGTLCFAGTNYYSTQSGALKEEYGKDYGDNNIYDPEKSITLNLVKDYGERLRELGLSIDKERLITIEDLRGLGCQYNESTGSGSCKSISSEKNFVNYNSYWTSTAGSSLGVIVVRDGNVWNNAYASTTYNGLRPVIEINSDYLMGNVTLSFDTNGGEEIYNSRLVRVGSTYQNLPEPTREGYTFLGWNGKNPVTPPIIGKGISSTNGTELVRNKSAASDYIEIDYDKYDSYYVSGLTNKLWSFIAFYDENYLPLGRTSGTARTSTAIRKDASYTTVFNESDNKPKYIRITQYEIDGTTVDPITVISEANIMVNPGESAEQYEPYYVTNGTTVVQNESHTLKAIWKEN